MSIDVRNNSDWGLSAGQGRAVMVLGGGDELPVSGGEGAETIDFALEVFGETPNYRISVTGGQARLSDIVPLARQLSTKLALRMLNRLGRGHEFVPCRKGCSACCSYVIPLSIPEAFRFREEVLDMPVDMGRAVLQRCLDVSSRIIGDMLAECCGGGPPRGGQASAEGSTEASRVVEWYGGLDIACPLISDGLCAHYDQRPTVCREHIVTGSVLACRADKADDLPDGESHIAAVPVSVVQALGQLTAELEGSDVEAVMLPLALPWAEDNLERCRRTWPAKFMVERFVEILQQMALKNSAIGVGS